MASWNHSMCLTCWRKQYGDRVPTRVKDDNLTLCCWCGRQTTHGIYVREDPQLLNCRHDR